MKVKPSHRREKDQFYPEDIRSKGETVEMFPDDGKNKAGLENGSENISNKKSCTNYFKEFTSHTSLHGLQYLGEDERHLAEKIWWIIMFLLSLTACTYLIANVWIKWDQTPVIVSLSETTTPVWEIPFPAVTICSETKVLTSKLNLTDYLLRYPDLSENETLRLEAASLLCDNHVLTEGHEFGDKQIMDIISEVTPSVTEMLFACKFKDDVMDCKDILFPTITEEGVCTTFNLLDANEFYRHDQLNEDFFYHDHNITSDGWTLDNGYPKNRKFDVFPHRAIGAGSTAGLVIVLVANISDLDYNCKGPVQGFKVTLHTPADYPRVEQSFFRLPLNQEVMAIIKPSILSTSSALKNYNSDRRKCFFQNERRLRYFQVYTQNNCELECLANYTKVICDCVPYYLPRDHETPICSAGSRNCTIGVKVDLLTRGIADDDSDDLPEILKNLLYELATGCNCLPPCNEITYDVETSQAKFEWNQILQSSKEEAAKMKMSRLTMFFKQPQFLSSTRYELYGVIDFLANCGGLLGLCLGFSVLSLVEIIYFLTIRAFFTLRNKIRARRSTNNIAD